MSKLKFRCITKFGTIFKKYILTSAQSFKTFRQAFRAFLGAYPR